MLIHELEQIRALADPLRLKILGAMGRRPRTTKQVAEVLGEKPTKLYHHVDTLERVGLIKLTETRPNRGTIEKYYQAVANRFEVGPSVFSTEPPSGEVIDAAGTVVKSLLDTAGAELALLARGGGNDRSKKAMVGRADCTLSPDQADQFRERLLTLLEEIKTAGQRAGGRGDRSRTSAGSYSVVVAFYPSPTSPKPARRRAPQ
jgi:DNA-binding transcriptional ArsR family regulator